METLCRLTFYNLNYLFIHFWSERKYFCYTPNINLSIQYYLILQMNIYQSILLSLFYLNCLTFTINNFQEPQCRYFYSTLKFIQYSGCKSNSLLPLHVQITVTALKSFQWKGYYNWDYYLSDYTELNSYCVQKMPFPSAMVAGDQFKLQLYCEKLPRQLHKGDYIMIITFWYAQYLAIDYALVPIPGVTEI